MAIANKSQTFPKNPIVDIELLARGVEQFLIQREDMVCQILRTPTGISIQTKKKDDWKKYILLDNAMQVDLTETDQFITAQVGGAKWIAKGAAMGVGMIVMWPIGIPLMALSSIGGFSVINLPKKILDFIDQFIMTGGKNIVIPPESSIPEYQPMYQTQPQTASVACPSCDEAIPAGTKFCPECGASTIPKKTICPACNAELDGSPKFCPECGEKF